jgi:hypothetical protein
MKSTERAYPLRVIRVVLTERRALLVYPDKQTSSELVGALHAEVGFRPNAAFPAVGAAADCGCDRSIGPALRTANHHLSRRCSPT